ncbi:MAG: EAL domain-containing protein [Alphaproteobacteria bacterium]
MAERIRAGADSRLLVLDDDVSISQMIGFIAESEGFLWRAAACPDDFFRELAEWRPSHIVLDLILPDMDGIEVMRNLGMRGCRSGLIIMSGTGSRVVSAAQRSASEHGLNIIGVLNKPFAPSALRDCLRAKPAATPEPVQSVAVGPSIGVEDIRLGIEAQQFELFFQPKIVCLTGELAGYEGLARWRRPDGTLVLPDRFIPLAERVGLIDSLSERIFDLALDWLAACDGPCAGLPLSVNLSASSLNDISFADRIAERCADRAIAPDRLIFELTETSAMRDPVTALDLLTRLRLKGFSLSIDDFGTGYSSALQLVRLPFSEMKVDRSFVMTAAASEESQAVIKSVVDLGHSLGLWVTAEGVESAEALAFLREVGCDQAQGYLIGRPMPAAEAAIWRPDPALRPVAGGSPWRERGLFDPAG